MKHTFFLRDKRSKSTTSILFQCYFKQPGKKFVYSTGESIYPGNWNFSAKQPFKQGSKMPSDYTSISNQLSRYTVCFNKIMGKYAITNEEVTPEILREEFNKEFKKAPTGKNAFFDAYDEFVKSTTIIKSWKPATIMRYNHLKNTLKKFEKKKDYKLTFGSINTKFEAEFKNYCLRDSNYANNTLHRVMGFLTTFMKWSIENKYTYNDSFNGFHKTKEIPIKQVVLELKDLQNLMQHNFKGSKERIRDVFVFQCVTGMRFGELKLINNQNIKGDYIELKEEKDSGKKTRKIPLNDVSKHILSKYNNRLPLIANQKHNEGIKDVLEDAGYTDLIEKTLIKGGKDTRTVEEFYKRVTTHTARRTFVTMMKKKSMPDKLIGAITGQSIVTINKYYQVDLEDTKKAVNDTFSFDFTPKLRKA